MLEIGHRLNINKFIKKIHKCLLPSGTTAVLVSQPTQLLDQPWMWAFLLLLYPELLACPGPPLSLDCGCHKWKLPNWLKLIHYKYHYNIGGLIMLSKWRAVQLRL